jgi:dephospho-CoA kinase
MPRQPCVVGLTGGLASGKSTVGKLLAAAGVPLLDADRLVHGLYKAGEAGATAVWRVFGRSVMTPDGAVDRAALARRVLADDAGRRRLEREIHPLVRAEIRAWLATLGEPSIAVVEAALLVETGSWRDYDVLLVVWCEPEQQLERAVARGMSRDRASRLIAAQATLEQRRAVADVEIDNSGLPSRLAAVVDVGWRAVCDFCRARTG